MKTSRKDKYGDKYNRLLSHFLIPVKETDCLNKKQQHCDVLHNTQK